MIHTIRTVAVGDQESKIDSPIILYRGDREVEVEFTINGSKFTFTNGGNVIKSTNATHGQLVINTPTGENMFSEVTECHDGKVVFVITKEMIDELIEVGFYSFQIRLFDESQVSRVTIPPVLKGIDIRNPIAAEDETNVVDIGLVDYAVVVKDEFEDLSTFLPDGNYNKTEWESKDVISGAKLNKIEDALYNINSNMEATDLALFNKIENINKNVYGKIDAAEANIMAQVNKGKADMEAMVADVEGELADVEGELDDIIKKITISVTDYGAKGDGVTNDTASIQKALNEIKPYSTLYFPPGSYIIETLTIPKNKLGLKIFGASMQTTKLIFSSIKAFSCLSGYITFKNMEVRGCGVDASILFSDDRNELTADFDITLKDCLFTRSQNLLDIKGRGVILEGCTLKEWLQGGYIINANFPNPLEGDDAWTQTPVTGFRSFIIRNNRFHFVTSTILNNTGYNAKNLTGVHITGNYIEGPMKFINGYVRDLLVKGNTQYQVPTNNTHIALFTLHGGDNINIDLLFSLSNRDSDVGYDSILISDGVINNMCLTGVIYGLKTKGVELKGGGSQIKIDLSIERIQGGSSTHFVHFVSGTGATIFRNIDIKCRLESPNVNFIGFEADETVTVLNYSTEMLMGGTYGAYSKGLNPLHCVSQPSITKTYIGNGTETTINLKFMPRTVQIIGIEGNGETPTYNNVSVANYSSANIVRIEDGGFTVTGAANVYGKKYIYITT